MNGSSNFNTVLMNPPYSLKWSRDKEFLKDPRFSDYGILAPKSKADYAFVLHGLSKLSGYGTMAVVLPHGVLFRGSAEGKIRKQLVQNNLIYAIIGLPGKLFNATDIPTVILVLKKGMKTDDILFIDASREYVKGKNQNTLSPKIINKIVATYKARKDVKRYAHLASFEEIKENDFNLNLPRYVDTFVPEPPVDLLSVVKDLHETSVAIKKNTDELIKMLGDLTSDDAHTMDGIKALIKELKEENG